MDCEKAIRPNNIPRGMKMPRREVYAHSQSKMINLRKRHIYAHSL